MEKKAMPVHVHRRPSILYSLRIHFSCPCRGKLCFSPVYIIKNCITTKNISHSTGTSTATKLQTYFSGQVSKILATIV